MKKNNLGQDLLTILINDFNNGKIIETQNQSIIELKIIEFIQPGAVLGYIPQKIIV